MSSLESGQDGRDFDRRLAEAFRSGLDLPPDTDLTTLAFGEHRNWDSLGHMSLVVALEEAFGVALADGSVFEIDSYASAAVALRALHRGS